MKTRLPLIVGFGGYNAAGRSSGHRGYQRMIADSLSSTDRQQMLQSLSSLMGLPVEQESAILSGSLLRKLDGSLFDTEAVSTSQNIVLDADAKHPLQFDISRRQMPEQIPDNWRVEPIDDSGRRFRVYIDQALSARVQANSALTVRSAGQLPTGFDPGAHYRSQHHPRGLQMSVMAASDAVHSLGFSWQAVTERVSQDQIAVYSSSAMAQLDQTGFGGLMSSRAAGQRVSSKQLALGFNSMPADFTNAYVLGSLGATGAVSGACATFLYNLRWAVEEIRAGRRKVALVGVSEAPILPEIIDGYAAMGALATDADLCKLDGVATPDYRRASRPFGDNCGFTLAESAQYVVLMADDLALELGANIYGAVPGVYVSADGFKKSISAPGPGNFITLAKAVALANNLVGESIVKNASFLQAHGSSTPQNRVTESKIFNDVAAAFGLQHWPVAAVKSYLGHSLGTASGDQMMASLGVFAHGILPGIKTVDTVADDVHGQRLGLSQSDQELGRDGAQVAFLNSKGFGGNNASATVFSPQLAKRFLDKQYTAKQLSDYETKRECSQANYRRYIEAADKGEFNPIYHFGEQMVDENKIEITSQGIKIPGFNQAVSLDNDEGFERF